MLEEYFAAKKRLYPQSVKGRFRQLKNKLNAIFLSIYCLSPFIRFDRGLTAPNQAILIDITNSKAYFFFIEIWPQEVYYLTGILIIAAITLFFVTSLFGRIWCGYACFQTVWTDIFISVEKLFQGDRNERILLDRKKTFEKLLRKTATHFCWIIIALLTGFIFTCYFNDSIALTQSIIAKEVPLKVLGWILGIAGMTYLMAGFAREHVCTFMCPYSRFQSAMFDNNTLIISYDAKRGEPRGKLQKVNSAEISTCSIKQDESIKTYASLNKQGDCIDCKQCVVVCPVGIDIRNGLQMECIACGLCIDACDGVMEKIGLPKGLIRYDTFAHLLDPKPEKQFKVLKPRTIYYSIILIVVCGLMLRSLIFKTEIETTIIPDRNPIFVTLKDGSVRNGYVIKIANKTHEKKNFKLKIDSPSEAVLKIQNNDLQILEVEAESISSFKVFVTLPENYLQKIGEEQSHLLVKFSIIDEKEEKKIESIFIAN